MIQSDTRRINPNSPIALEQLYKWNMTWWHWRNHACSLINESSDQRTVRTFPKYFAPPGLSPIRYFLSGIHLIDNLLKQPQNCHFIQGGGQVLPPPCARHPPRPDTPRIARTYSVPITDRVVQFPISSRARRCCCRFYRYLFSETQDDIISFQRCEMADVGVIQGGHYGCTPPLGPISISILCSFWKKWPTRPFWEWFNKSWLI